MKATSHYVINLVLFRPLFMKLARCLTVSQGSYQASLVVSCLLADCFSYSVSVVSTCLFCSALGFYFAGCRQKA